MDLPISAMVAYSHEEAFYTANGCEEAIGPTGKDLTDGMAKMVRQLTNLGVYSVKDNDGIWKERFSYFQKRAVIAGIPWELTKTFFEIGVNTAERLDTVETTC